MAIIVTGGFALGAVMLTWPLAGHLTTALLGDPTGDTGVYVWNIWIFRHEFLRHGHLPFSTDHLFAYTGPADFGLHNYTPIAGVLGLLFIPWLGVVGAFNMVTLAILAVSGLGVYLLGRQVGLQRTSAWAAGVLFIASPLMTARETAHLSLITTAALPLFLWALLRAIDRPRLRRGALAGVMVAAATYSDAYFGIYCVLMGVFVLGWSFLRLETRAATAGGADVIRGIDAAGAMVAALLAWRLISGATVLFLGPIRVSMVTLYTPMLVLLVLGGLRVWLRRRPSLRVHDPDHRCRALVGPGLLAVATCLVLLSPLLAGLAVRYADGRLPSAITDWPYWRSSPRGVDLLAYVVPNSSHPWFGHWTQRWLLPEAPDAFPEYVAGFSLLAVAVVTVAAWRRILPGMWVAFTSLFVLLSLGPFIHVGGINTFFAGPWAFLRYVPIVDMARSPARFAIVATMGLSLLAAFALEAWLRTGHRRGTMFASVAVFLMAFELVPAPRRLYSAAVPDVYRLIATANDAGDPGSLLELPAGLRDGTSSMGDFNASSQYFQTSHRRPLIGGYLSRVSDWRKAESLGTPMLRVLYALSERPGLLPDDVVESARQSRDEFLARSCMKFVIVDKERAASDLRAVASDVLDLVSVHEDDRYELLTPRRLPTCESRSARRALRSRRIVPAGQ